MPYPASQISYERTGDGPPALMVHGNPATHTLWRPLAGHAAGMRTVYTIDLPGFGGSPAPETRAGFSLPELARAVLTFADLHGLERFDLVGHSFGGAVAITLATEAPERVRSLVAITPMTSQPPPLAHLLDLPFIEGAAESLWRTSPSRFRRWFAREWTHVSYGDGYSRSRAEEVSHEADRPDLVPSICGLMLEADYAAYSRTLFRLADMWTLPLLLIGAGADRVIPHAQFLHLRSCLWRAACRIFPDCGHVPMWQYPDELAEIMERFWKEVR